jgi:hypothetical protein
MYEIDGSGPKSMLINTEQIEIELKGKRNAQ